MYFLRIFNMDETTDSDDVAASNFYGPYRTKGKAEKIGKQITETINKRCLWADTHFQVHLIEKCAMRKVINIWLSELETISPYPGDGPFAE